MGCLWQVSRGVVRSFCPLSCDFVAFGINIFHHECTLLRVPGGCSGSVLGPVAPFKPDLSFS